MSDNKRGFQITVTDEGKEIIKNIVIGCASELLMTLITKNTIGSINEGTFKLPK